MSTTASSLLDYYRSHEFNPVPIDVEDRAVWEDHFAKRTNLYQRHLGIPLRLLRGSRVLEFGCNSGENALVLAAHGAELTLVEPNEQVLPRLHALFAEFGLQDHIARLEQQGMDDFAPDEGGYDLVIAEGFLSTMTGRDGLLGRMCDAIGAGGLGVMSFNDRYGLLLEQTRRACLYRVCELAGVEDPRSAGSLALARRLFADDFAKLSASRAFEVWWQDQLVNPFLESDWLWSYDEILPVLEARGFEFHASSPRWAQVDDHTWYKNVSDTDSRRRQIREAWSHSLPFTLTGLAADTERAAPAQAIDAVAGLVASISRYTTRTESVETVTWSAALADFLQASPHADVRAFGVQLGQVYEGLRATTVEGVLAAWHGASRLRDLWGAPYHYLCFHRSL
ncbi:MAG TPA: class I SAM-dependent methyltransferase [Candidatus Latescibacteria bacterium]|nr:class I SAM-dependent methyltransferase [Candidatus Latescibacterota bacterium]